MTALGIAIAIAAGFALLGFTCSHGSRPGQVALWFTLGSAAFTALVLSLNLARLEMTAAIWVASGLSLAGVFWRLVKGERRFVPGEPLHVIDAVPALALAAFVWKIAIVELWSWDYFTIWGMKARWFAASGSFTPAFLSDPQFLRANPSYPIGYPALLTALSFGGEISAFGTKLLHVAVAISLVLFVREVVRLLTGSPVAAAITAAFVALSPLFWDTESLGLAELPLVAAALGAIVIFLAPGARMTHFVAAGALLGWMSWLKVEAGPLSALVLVTLLVGRRFRWTHRAQLVGAWGVIAIAASIFGRFLPDGMSFFTGDHMGRALSRLKDYHVILAPVVAELTRPAWLGCWIFAAIVIARYASWRRRMATCLGAAVVLQMAFYISVYFFTYLDPLEHIDSSFYRISAAILPLALVAATSLLLATEDRSPEDAVVEETKFR
jgi:hypothetical protein